MYIDSHMFRYISAHLGRFSSAAVGPTYNNCSTSLSVRERFGFRYGGGASQNESPVGFGFYCTEGPSF